MSRLSTLILLLLPCINSFCQQYPRCLDQLIVKTAEEHKKNPCEGTDELLRLEEYSYENTLLYKLVFEQKNSCPDHINRTVYYDAGCQVRMQINDGGLKYKREVIPAGVDTKEIKFVRSVSYRPEDRQQDFDNSGYLSTDPKGKALKEFYLGLHVEDLWIAGSHIDWETGVADKPEATAGNHTHCSAFVASACKKMGIYILRPPEHGQLLLANAQCDWLKSTEALQQGWEPITGNNQLSIYMRAQTLANSGSVVVAIIKNPDHSQPGHAALVMPREIDKNHLEESGPSLIMAGRHNFNLISLKNGFKSHLNGWPENQILFFVNNKNL